MKMRREQFEKKKKKKQQQQHEKPPKLAIKKVVGFHRITTGTNNAIDCIPDVRMP